MRRLLIFYTGWCGTDEAVPQYDQSYTWFTAHVQRTGGQNDPHHETVQMNRRGNPKFADHHVIWHADPSSMSTSRFVRSLCAGDIIQLFPRAHYSGWVNIVAAATIKIWYMPRHIDLVPPSPSATVGQPSIYKQLNNDETRILEIQPGKFDEPVHCHLIHHRLSDDRNRAFEALSYCWGNIDQGCIIYLHDIHGKSKKPASEFPVAENVLSALRHLRHSDRVRNIWIDAICINQLDFEERSNQVSMMSEIYSNASQVNVWLGEDYPGSSYAIMMVREMYNSQHKICPGAADCHCKDAHHLRDPRGDDSVALHPIEEVYRNEYPDFASNWGSFFSVADVLFGNPWFRRVWVLQEALIPRRVMVQCGNYRIPWVELIEIGEHMNKNLYVNHLSPKAAIPGVWSTLRAIANDEMREQPRIADIFLEALEMEASDPRDKVWALLAFGRDTNPETNTRLADRMRPDYTKAPAQMFADFTRWCISQQSSLSVLSTVHGLRGRMWQSLHSPGAASRSIQRPSWAVGSLGSIKWAHATLQHCFSYRAAGDTEIDMELVEQPSESSILCLKGFSVTRIRHIGLPSLQQLSKVAPKLFEAFITLFDLARTQETWVTGKIDQLEARGPTFELGKRFGEHQRAHWGYGPRTPSIVIKPNEIGGRSGEIEIAEDRDIPSCIDPCFFVSEDGWCGLCPSGAQCGDLAVVLLGAEVPHLLRSMPCHDGRNLFEFVGECYLEGAMDGEVVEARKAETILPEIFSLV